MTQPSVKYKRHSFPPQIIAHAVWLQFQFPHSLRLVEEILRESGIVLSYEIIRRWAMKCRADYAHRSKRKKTGRRDNWRLDEIVQVYRKAKAARRLPTRLLHQQRRRARQLVAAKLGSCVAA